MRELPIQRSTAPRWGKVIDQDRCIGCHACTTACKSENEVPVGVTRTYVKYVEVGAFPNVRRNFQVTRCNQCEDAPCVEICPTAAMFQRGNGIVDFDKSNCIGCKACIAACPYDAIFINPDDHCAEKCNLCAHRLEVGLEPACVVVCPTQAISVGDLNDAGSAFARLAQREALTVRKPEKGTQPKLFYKGAHMSTLDPLAATRPAGGLFMWSEQQDTEATVVSGTPLSNRSSAAALLAYDVVHAKPWDWRVSAYTWTKGISAGSYLVAAVLVLSGWLAPSSQLWLFAAPAIALSFLALTGLFLIWDLDKPARFFMILTRHQWKSWLVRGAFIIGGYGVLLSMHLVFAGLDQQELLLWLALAGIPLSIMTAVYTAFLFAQARGRDLWQSPMLAPHLLVQAVLLGAGALLPAVAFLAPEVGRILLWTMCVSGVMHLLLVLCDLLTVHSSTHARLAVHELARGRYSSFFWASVVLSLAGCFAPLIDFAAVSLALIGMLLYEHAYVQSGQAVPLA